MYTDSHLHFDAFEEEGESEAVIQRAQVAGVSRMVAVGGTVAANQLAVSLAERWPGTVRAVAGYDRDEANQFPSLDTLRELWRHPEVCGVGETGLDYHYCPDSVEAQKTLFASMLKGARDHVLPVVVHSREAGVDTIRLLEDHCSAWKGDPDRVGVLHCFTGDLSFARELLSLGMMISFSGIVTFKKAESLRGVAASIPDDRLLIETDSPYLAPVPYRGKRNEPAYVPEIALALADVRGCQPQDIAQISTGNAARLFGWKDEVQ